MVSGTRAGTRRCARGPALPGPWRELASLPTCKKRCGIGVLFVVLASFFAAAAEIDVSKLPPAATTKVDFNRDVRPIFEQSCLRCHGQEKPRSHFRLTTREAALKGGDSNTNDIVPSDSGSSRLIHYVSGLVEAMQMPPTGKAEPLTPSQIGLLRAWIDQGTIWGGAEQFPQSSFVFTPALRWTGVEGNRAEFRDIEGVKEGFGGGVEQFSLQERDTADTKLSVEGHVRVPEDDLRLTLDWSKTDAGFVRGGFDRWRKYYNDRGGFFPPATSFSLDRDLHLDTGRAWIDFGLILPNWPQLVLGYEYQFKEGDEATSQWGPVAVPGAPVPKSIFPAAKHIDEHTHVVKLDAGYDLLGWHLEDSARVEFYSLGTSRTNQWPDAFLFTQSDSVAALKEHDRHTQGANTISASKELADWMTVSTAYFYSRLDGDSSVNQMTLDTTGNPIVGQQWSANDITLKRETQSASLASLLGPWSGFTLSLGVQGDWTRQEGMGLETLLYGTPANRDPFLLSSTNTVIANYDRAGTRENILLRYTKIPWTVVFGEARLRQESLRQFEQGYIEAFTLFGPFTNNTDADTVAEEYRVGFNSSPWQRLSFGASLKHGDKHTDYISANTLPGNYPGFIRWRNIGENQLEARLVYRPASWLKTSFSYRWQNTDFDSATGPSPAVTPGGPIEAGEQEVHVYSVNTVLTPLRRLYLSSTYSYSDSRIRTALDGTDGLVPWKGNVYSVLSSATFAVDPATALNATYSYSISDYAQANQASGLPAGINYQYHSVTAGLTHRFSNNVVAGLRYSFSQYREPTAGRSNDFTAHSVLATLAVPWP
jgi:hypothetical protein